MVTTCNFGNLLLALYAVLLVPVILYKRWAAFAGLRVGKAPFSVKKMFQFF